MSKFKTRTQIAYELGISRRTFLRWIKKDKIELRNRLVSPKEQLQIYKMYGITIEENGFESRTNF